MELKVGNEGRGHWATLLPCVYAAIHYRSISGTFPDHREVKPVMD